MPPHKDRVALDADTWSARWTAGLIASVIILAIAAVALWNQLVTPPLRYASLGLFWVTVLLGVGLALLLRLPVRWIFRRMAPSSGGGIERLFQATVAVLVFLGLAASLVIVVFGTCAAIAPG